MGNFKDEIMSQTTLSKSGCDFYTLEGATCDKNAVWKGPGGGKSSFYTTWSYYAIIVSTIAALFIIPLFHRVPSLKNSPLMAYTLLAILVGFAANSMAVAVASQGLLGFDWHHLDPTQDGEVLITEEWVKTMNKVNITVHLIPLILSIIILFLVINVPWSGNKRTLVLASCFVPIVLFTIWVCVPVPVKPGSSKKTTPFTKVEVVYDKSSPIIESFLPITIIFICVLYVYAMRGNKLG